MTNKPLTFISLFAGIGGFDLALERAGLQCVAQVEIDAKARAVLHHHWPQVPQFEDVRQVCAHNLPPADVICGGFPCQDLSVAGKRAGFAGQRSVLFYEMTRIVNELRPAFLIWENVPGLLSSRGGADFHGVLTELDSIGYSGAWTMLDAQFFGVAQRRRRVFGVFARADIGAKRCAEILSLAARLPGHSAPRRGAGPQPAGEVAESAGDRRAGTAHTVAAPQVARQAKGGFTDPVSDNIIAADVAVTLTSGPSSAASHNKPSGRSQDLNIVAFQQNQRDELRDVGAVAGAINAEPGMHNQNFIAYNIQHNDGGDHKRADRPNGGLYVNETDTALTVGTTDLTVIAQAVDIRNLKMQPGEVSGTVQSKKTGGHSLNYLNPVMVENAPQADNDAQANHIVFQPRYFTRDNKTGGAPSDLADITNAAKAGDSASVIAFSAGNSAKARSMGESENISPPLRAAESGTNQTPTIAWEMSHGSEAVRESGQVAPTLQQRMGTGGNQVPLVGVRRLTPVECERLQGFPDNWTQYGVLTDNAGKYFSPAKLGLQADSTRYRQLGNAVAVPVVEWIARRLVAHYPTD